MAKLLYWGHKGLQRNLQAALKYYEDAAKDGDPIAMYDYGLALIKVRHVDIMITRASFCWNKS